MDNERLKEEIKIYKKICDDAFINTLSAHYKIIVDTKSENSNKKNPIMNFEILKINKKHSGFGGECYIKGEKIIIAYAAAWGPADYGNMIGLVAGFLTRQYNDALNFYLEIKYDPKYEECDIMLTGSSLGGVLAQAVAATTGCKAIVFNSWDIRDLLPKIGMNPKSYYPNITHIRSSNDILYKLQGLTGNKGLGDTYIVEADEKNPIKAHQSLDDLLDKDLIPSEIWEKEHNEKKNYTLKPSLNFINSKHDFSSLSSIPISDIPEIKNSSLIKSIDKINEILNLISYNTLVQSTSIFRQIIPTFSKTILNSDYTNNNNNNNSCMNIIKKLQDSYNTFNNRDYEKELIKEADRIIAEARRLEREELKQEIKQEIMKEIMRAYKEALYRSQGMTDERFNAIMTYISEQLKEALHNKSFYKKYYLPAEI